MKSLIKDPDLKPGLLVRYDHETYPHVASFFTHGGEDFKGQFAEVVKVLNNGLRVQLWWPGLDLDTEGVTEYYRKLKED